MAGLVQATSLQPSAGGYVATLDPAWNIWGPAGGYIAAIALRAVRHHADPAHRPLTLTGQFVRVARPGHLDVQVMPVKSGGTALFSVTLSQDANTVFQAQVWTSSRNDMSLPTAPVIPIVAAPHGLRPIDDLMTERGVDVTSFWQNLDGRPTNFRTAGDPPADDSHQYRWMRFRDWEPTNDPFLDAMRAVLLIDIGIWPAHWHRQSERGNYLAPSLDVWAHFHGTPTAGDWLLSDAITDVSGHGTISGTVRIWSEAGQAMATGGGHCLVAIPRAKAM